MERREEERKIERQEDIRRTEAREQMQARREESTIMLSKNINNDQELIQSDPTPCPQNHKGNN